MFWKHWGGRAMRKLIPGFVVLLQALACGFFVGRIQAQNSGRSELLASQIDRLNHELTASPAPLSKHARSLLAERSTALSLLIELDPSRALSLKLPRIEADRLRIATPPDGVESIGDWEGVVDAAVVDNFERGTSRTIVYLTIGNERVQIHFAGSRPDVKSGDVLRVHGMRLGAAVAADHAEVAQVADSADCSSVGQQNIAVLLVNMPGATLPSSVTPAYVNQVLFGTGETSLDGFWREASYGVASATGTVFGPFALSHAYSCYMDISPGAIAEVIEAAGSTVDVTKYNRFVVINQINDNSCPAAQASLGCWEINSSSHGTLKASYSVFRYPMAPNTWSYLIQHEMGHNLGLNHASSVQFDSVPLGAPGEPGKVVEYGDPYSAMGQNSAHYAAPHKCQLGWMPAGSMRTVETGGTFLLLPFESATVGLKALRVRRSAGIDQYLWVEYRQPLGYDAGFQIPQLYGGATIHLEDPTTTLWSGSQLTGYTYLLDFTAATTPGNFTDPALAVVKKWSDPSSSLSLTVSGATASGLSVTIDYEPPCAAIAPVNLSFSSNAQAGSISVVGDCASSASTTTNWITITSGASLTGSGAVGFRVSANTSPMARTGTVSVARQIVTVTQASAS